MLRRAGGGGTTISNKGTDTVEVAKICVHDIKVETIRACSHTGYLQQNSAKACKEIVLFVKSIKSFVTLSLLKT